MLINLLFLLLVIFSFDLRSQTLENQFNSPVHVLANIKEEEENAIGHDSFDTEWVKNLKLLLSTIKK